MEKTKKQTKKQTRKVETVSPEEINGKDHVQILEEKKATDDKHFTVEEVKAIKDEAKGIERAGDEKEICAVCGMPILKGQAFKILPADEKNPRRKYHQPTCSPGSRNWNTFRAGKSKMKVVEKRKNQTPQKVSASNPKQDTSKKKFEKKGKVDTRSSPRKYNDGTQIDTVFKLVEGKTDMENMIKTFMKKFPDTKTPKTHIHWYLGKIKRDGYKIKREGNAYSLEK